LANLMFTKNLMKLFMFYYYSPISKINVINLKLRLKILALVVNYSFIVLESIIAYELSKM